MRLFLLPLLVVPLLSESVAEASGEDFTPTLCPTLSPQQPQEKNTMAMAWVGSAVPVSIVKLFLEDDGACLRVQKLNAENNLDVKNMCNFVKTLTTEYVSASSSASDASYVLQAIRRADSYSNNVTCNCLMAKDIRKKTLAHLQALAGNPLTEVSAAVSSAHSQITGVFASFSKSKCGTSYKGWEDICGVTALLLDFLPDEQQQVPSPCPKLQAPPPCNCSCNQSDSNVTSGSTDKEKNGTTATAIQPKPSNVTATPTKAAPTSSRVARTPTTKPPTGGSESRENTSIPESFVFVAVAVVLVAFLGYVGYYNREYLMKQFSGLCNGRKDGRPKKKNYKHLKSVKDALP